ncbi:MAG: hypothetical protein ACT4PT_08810 [Methanobacteriota archaeon]
MTGWGGHQYCPHCKKKDPRFVGSCPKCKRPLCDKRGCKGACAAPKAKARAKAKK